MPEVWITGVGVVGPHGLGIDALLEDASAEKSAFSPWPADQDPPDASAVVGTVSAFPKEKYFSERQLRQIDRPMALSTVAAGLALEDAGLGGGTPVDETATFFATARSEQTSMLRFNLPLLEGRPRQLNPANFPWMSRNISCGQIAVRFGLRGPSTTLASGPLASIEAVSRAYDFLSLGRAPIALAGGTEVLSKFALYMLRAEHGEEMLRRAPAFLGAQPGRIIPSEGSCMLVLETSERARARGAVPYARIDGWEAGRLGQENWSDGLNGAWTRLVDKIGNTPGRVGLLSVSSGGSNRPYEQAEARALQRWANAAPSAARVCAPRSFAGEGECWTGALQVALAAASLRARRAAPTWNLSDDAPDAVRSRSRGGPLEATAALVAGMESSGRYGALHLTGGVR